MIQLLRRGGGKKVERTTTNFSLWTKLKAFFGQEVEQNEPLQQLVLFLVVLNLVMTKLMYHKDMQCTSFNHWDD